ncbi:hypothetical protein R1flu_011870 [Riccia fluitans]|uniref:Uncharacterized protein n=1 Tax=Riccia fluitans TaxID=41844 RepID=A0ABD1ZA55_9MARC
MYRIGGPKHSTSSRIESLQRLDIAILRRWHPALGLIDVNTVVMKQAILSTMITELMGRLLNNKEVPRTGEESFVNAYKLSVNLSHSAKCFMPGRLIELTMSALQMEIPVRLAFVNDPPQDLLE